jgi:hypothetical protein
VSAFEITVLRKADSLPLTKRIALARDGSLMSDGRACVMSRGTACRFRFSHIGELAELIEDFGSDQALTLGGLRSDLPARVEITTKRRLNGAASPNIIARTRDHITYRSGEPALALVDCDMKGMPQSVADKIIKLGGLWHALLSVIPEAAGIARVIRQSTSAGLYRADTGTRLPSTGGTHVFLAVQDGEDIERFLRALHARCRLAGLGWLMVGAGGQILERSIVDRVVGSPERLVFEGAPVLDPPLAQDKASRRPVVTEGEVLDSLAACPSLTILEGARLRELHAKEAIRLTPEADKARKAFVTEHAERVARGTGMPANLAVRVIERQCTGVLLPDVVLPFDDEDLAGATVADVLADPDRFEDATLADPLEGIEYGACKAKIMRRADNTLWINSFAHGRTVYELRFDYRSAKGELEKAPAEAVADVFVRLTLAADLDMDEVEQLRNFVHQRTGISKRTLSQKLKAARQLAAVKHAEEERGRRIAERRDPRPQIPAPTPDAPWLPQMAGLNEVMGAATEPEPPMRDNARH